MQIKRLVIENFKSIERIELIEPNPFTVFVGPNGSGKSNIFEALEFVATASRFNRPHEAVRLFGGEDKLFRRAEGNNEVFSYELHYGYGDSEFITMSMPFGSTFRFGSQFNAQTDSNLKKPANPIPKALLYHFIEQFKRVLVNAPDRKKSSLEYQDGDSLNFSASNLEPVLKRLLINESLKIEIFDWLSLFVPGFKAVEIDDRDELHWFEVSSDRYFTKDLISDGTYNILALLTAVYQSDDPQFLCIEEPENGLNPKVTRELVQLFRFACEEYGHYIWLNTQSQSLVSVLTPEEIILVDKVDGATKTKQVAGMNLHGLPMDEAWLSNALGGGIPW
ncbi:AAA family ATPase [Fibrella forsythiae]|uniref:AAA family ATPase n=1 Tax=Fibrella forsythiae TaxID=2817061 RepID=A0ABS3JEW7_9BACT|nr:AAA family ATPase [Fibrella forsythiae]MBO0948537.1 AAA family ATPase [Fibrella forsythiae]